MKFENNKDTLSKICRYYGEILKELPYVLFETQYGIYILEYEMKQYKIFNRVQFECNSVLYDKNTKDFFITDDNPTPGSLFQNQVIEKYIYFCNKNGLIKLLKKNKLQEKWLLFKLAPVKSKL